MKEISKLFVIPPPQMDRKGVASCGQCMDTREKQKKTDLNRP